MYGRYGYECTVRGCNAHAWNKLLYNFLAPWTMNVYDNGPCKYTHNFQYIKSNRVFKTSEMTKGNTVIEKEKNVLQNMQKKVKNLRLNIMCKTTQ